jgi:hypothetical protein
MVVKLADRFLRISESTYTKIKSLGFYNDMKMKTVLDKVFTGELNPLGDE